MVRSTINENSIQVKAISIINGTLKKGSFKESLFRKLTCGQAHIIANTLID